MSQPISRMTPSTVVPNEVNHPDQQLKAMKALASSMREEIQTLTQAIQINARANPQWEKVAKTLDSVKSKSFQADLTEGNLTQLSSCIATFEKKLLSRFGIEHPSKETENFCETVLPRVRLWKQGVNQLWQAPSKKKPKKA
jgi:hypothetical protein